MSATPTISDIEDVMREFVIAGSELDDGSVAWADENAPRLDEPFISLSIIGGAKFGQDAFIAPKRAADTELFMIEGPRTYSLSCRGFGRTIPDNMDNLLTATDSRDLLPGLRRAQVAAISIIGSGDPGVYSIRLEGVLVSLTTLSPMTLDQIADDMMDEINAADLPIPYVAATRGGTGIVIVTALPGVMFEAEAVTITTVVITTRSVDLAILTADPMANINADIGIMRDIGRLLTIEFASTARRVETPEIIETIVVENEDGGTITVP